MNAISANRIDYPALYSPSTLKAWQLPVASRDDPENGEFRRLLLRWADLPTRTADGEAVPLWFVCCDVLVLDKDVVIDRTAFIFARRIEVAGGASLILGRTEGDAPDLLVFAQEVVDKATGAAVALDIIAVDGDVPVETRHAFRPDAEAGATGLAWDASSSAAKTMTPADLDPAHFYDGSPLSLALVTTFQVATLLSGENVELSLSQLRWVNSLARASKGSGERELAGQASAMATTLLAAKAAGENALLVPRLDHEIYASASAAFMEVLRLRQQKWDALQAMLASDTHWANAAKDTLADQQNQRELAQKLEQQAEESRQQVLYARNIAAGQVVYERAQIGIREIAFELGIKRWKEKETKKEIINIVEGIFQILSQIPAIVAAGPQFTVLPAVETAKDIGIAILSVGKSEDNGPPPPNYIPTPPRPSYPPPPTDLPPPFPTGGTASPVIPPPPFPTGGTASPVIPPPPLPTGGTASPVIQPPPSPLPTGGATQSDELGILIKQERQRTQNNLVAGLKATSNAAKGIFDAATRINQIAAMAEDMERKSQKIYDEVNQTVGEAFASIELQGLDTVTGGEQEWNLLSASVENMFENFGGGILRKIDGGNDYCLEFRRLIICGKSLSQARLAMAKANAQLAELKLRRLTAEKSARIAQTRLDQLQNQIAREQILAQFAFNKVLDAKRSVYLAMDDYRRAFLYFTLADSAPPLPRITDTVDAFGVAVANLSSKLLANNALTQPPQTMNQEIILNDPSLLGSLKESGFVNWEVKPDDPAFNSFGRIRLNRVRIFAEGMQTAGDIEVQISSSGVYVDKRPLRGERRQFVSEPTRKNFVYSGINQDVIRFDGDIARRYADDFFNPTPFTTWTMQIRRQDGKLLDLSAVTHLRIQFFGEATPIN